MLIRNFSLAWRHLQRNKLYAAINVVGLSIGIAACLVIALIVQFELGFDDFRRDRDRIYRVYSQFSGVFESLNRGVAAGVAPWVKENVSGIAASTQFFSYSLIVSPLNRQGQAIEEMRQRDIAIVDGEFFSVFPDYRWLSGDPASALSRAGQVVITDKKALQYFGESNPLNAVGRELIYGDSTRMTVSGIIEAPDRRTDLHFQDFIPLAAVEAGFLQRDIELHDLVNTNSSSQYFIKLLPGKQVKDILPQIADLEAQYAEQNKDYGFVVSYRLQPMDDLHFNSELGIFDHSRRPAHRTTLYLLTAIALLLLLVAAINFVNLETAQSIRRAKEVGVRKVMGGSREALISQFLGQTLLLTSIAMIVALGLVEFSLWFFEDFIPRGLTFEPLAPWTLLFIFATTAVVAFLAGLYPAFVLSSFRPVLALKDRIGAMGRGAGSHNLRRGLVVFQFVIAQVLIFGTLVIGHQIRYMLNKDMGFQKDAIVYFFTPWQDTLHKQVLAEELRRRPDVLQLSRHAAPPAESGYQSSVMTFTRDGEEQSHNVFRKFGDTTYIHLYSIQLLAGRNLLPSDTVREMLINETLAHQLGFADATAAVGARLGYNDKEVPIVGIVKDFHTRSLHEPIDPVAIANQEPAFNAIGLKLATQGQDGEQLSTILTGLEDQWKSFYPDEPFDYEFLDEAIASFYESERQTAKLVRTATLVAILISCLGLFGLVTFAANQRTKEIGIRKVLGATVSAIVGLLSRELLLLVLVAFVLAIPLAWWAAQRWLSDFAYRIELSWWLFALGGALSLLIAYITMGVQAVRAARSNPADALRSE